MKPTPSFEQSLAKLAEIVEKVEDGETPLDELIALYKQGIELAKGCGEVLNKYESEVLVLQKTADEVFNLNVFPELKNSLTSE